MSISCLFGCESPLSVTYNDHSIRFIQAYDGEFWFNASDLAKATNMSGWEAAAAESCASDGDVSPGKQADACVMPLMCTTGETHRRTLRDLVDKSIQRLYGSASTADVYVDTEGIQSLIRHVHAADAKDHGDLVCQDLTLLAKCKLSDWNLLGIERSNMPTNMCKDSPTEHVTVTRAVLQSLQVTTAEVSKALNGLISRISSYEAEMKALRKDVACVKRCLGTCVDHSMRNARTLVRKLEKDARMNKEAPIAKGTADGSCHQVESDIDRRDGGTWDDSSQCVESVMGTRSLLDGGKVSVNLDSPEREPSSFAEVEKSECGQLSDLQCFFEHEKTSNISAFKLIPIEKPVSDTNGEASSSAFMLKAKRFTLGVGHTRLIGTYPSIAKIIFKECQGVCDLEPLVGLNLLKELDVDVNGEVRHFESLKRIPSLRILRMYYQNISNEEFSHLGRLENLEELTVYSAWDVTCLEALANMPRLRVLDLSLPTGGPTHRTGEKVDDHYHLVDTDYLYTDVSPLAQIATLEKLNLEGRGEILNGIGVLGTLPRLRVLNLSGTGASNESLQGISESKTLRVLNIRSCWNITNAMCITNIATLEELNIQIRSVGIPIPKSHTPFATLRVLHVHLPPLVGHLRPTDNSCDVASEPATISLTDIFPLDGATVLEELHLIGQGIIEVNIDVLPSLPKLRVLDLSGIDITTASLNAICAVRSLVKLGLTVRRSQGDLSILGKLTSLEELDIRSCCSSSSVVDVAISLPNLRALAISGATVTATSLRGLTKCSALTKLDLRFCRNVGRETPLPEMDALEEIYVEGCQSVIGVDAPPRFPKLRTIVAKCTYINPNTLREFRELGVKIRYTN
ncbi:unnamed protein product [Trypanosoma congolense IL3000]|uniref:WGS project CAEQ00000000 data, annotated contig 1360 n=1 Tax=Trypanosoma congolense (strain IL3000) TaxID=1068625 RepID=F9W5Q9_TRYCI|nr:unnamed protein product [Trypanosoma congolense IL3000]